MTTNRTNDRINSRTRNGTRGLFLRLIQGLLVLVIAATFSALALWQWDRAQSHQELELELARIATLEPVSLLSIHSPQIALDGEDANRMVEVTGRYIDAFTAAGQAEGSFGVALMEVAGSSPRAAILVARELASPSANAIPLDLEVRLLARLLPSQREDRDPEARLGGDEETLSRIDSAILLDRLPDPNLALYDGYLLLHEEIVAGSESTVDVIPDTVAEPTIPGYYWQHISYVVIWFLMAALTLYLPFYQRKRNRLTT